MPHYLFLSARTYTLASETFETPAQAQAQAEALAIRHRVPVTLAQVVASPVQPLCVFCEQPATVRAADWDLCDLCHEGLAGPWPEEAGWVETLLADEES